VAWLFLSYWWLPALVVLVILRRYSTPPASYFSQKWEAAMPLVTFLTIWIAYVIWTGGDIFEFRQLVNIIPVFIILLILLASDVVKSTVGTVLLVVFLLVGSVVHSQTFSHYVRPPGIGSFPNITELGNPDPTINWRTIGTRLHEDLPSDSGVIIAVLTAGAIPYISRLDTVDTVGLNDAWVARHGIPRTLCQVCQAHYRQASVSYLLSQRVNLLMGFPQWVPLGQPSAEPAKVVKGMFLGETIDYSNLPEGIKLLRIPLNQDTAVAALYLTPSPAVDELISQGKWLSQPVSRSEFR
jgi:hypothetical protein